MSLLDLLALLAFDLIASDGSQLVFEVGTELLVAAHKLPDAETLPVGEVLLLDDSCPQQSLGEGCEAHQCTITNRPRIRLKVLRGQYHRRRQVLSKVMLQQRVLEDESHDIECMNLRVWRWSSSDEVEKEAQRVMQQVRLVRQRL